MVARHDRGGGLRRGGGRAAVLAAALALALALGAGWGPAGARAQETYGVAFGDVLAKGVARKVELTKTGACLCDMTAHACDGNCGCDPDCSEAEKGLFTGSLPEAPESPTLQYCVPASSVATVNLPKSGALVTVAREAPGKDFLAELLCVASDNNPALGNFFRDGGPGSAAALDGALAAAGYSSLAAPSTAASGGPTSSDVYKVGDSVRAVFRTGYDAAAPANSSALAADVEARGGVFSLPVAAASGTCDVMDVVGFMYNVPMDSAARASSCERVAASIADACQAAGDFSATAVTDVKFASTPLGSPAYIAPAVTRVQKLGADGRLSAVAGGAVPATNLACAMGVCTCQNALQAVEYTITHNGNGVISAVDAAVVVTDVTSSTTGAAAVRQDYKVTFRSSGTTAAAVPNSGSPGYKTGYPVLGGVQEEDPGSPKVAVKQFKGGLPVPAAGPDGLCDPTAPSHARFGVSSSSSCHVPMTLAQLRTFCTSSSTYGVDLPAYLAQMRAAERCGAGVSDVPARPLPVQLLNGLLGAEAGGFGGKTAYVGIWGDSAMGNVAEWLELEVPQADDKMSWNEATATCSNVITGVRYEFLTTKIGAQTDPQESIAYARARFTSGDWTFRQPLRGSCVQKFHLQSHVEFAAMDQSAVENVSPPTPPLFSNAPDDFFYPFA